MENVFKIIAGTVTTALVYLFGGLDLALQALLIAIILDYLTGIAKGYVTKALNSNTGLKGIIKKLGILAMVALATAIDRIAGDTGLIRTLLCYYLVANEGLSIIENLGAMDIMVPKFLKDKLEQLKEKSGYKTQNEGNGENKMEGDK